MAAAQDIGLAGCGDFGALRRLRAHWLRLADGELETPLVPKEEALPQLELLAEIAASAIGEPEDVVALIVAYHVRMEVLQRDTEASQALAKEAAAADNVTDLARWASTEVSLGERMAHYRAKVRSLVTHLFNDENPEGSALLMKAVSNQADNGDELAAPLLHALMNAVSPERAKAIMTEIRKMERTEAQ